MPAPDSAAGLWPAVLFLLTLDGTADAKILTRGSVALIPLLRANLNAGQSWRHGVVHE